MLIPFSVLVSALAENRCVLSRKLLSFDEAVISRDRVPSLYDTSLNAKDKTVAREIVKMIVCNIHEIRLLFATKPDARLLLRRFFGLCLRHGGEGDEGILHAYLFAFWEDVVRQVSLGRPMLTSPRWASKEFGVGLGDIPAGEKAIAEKLIAVGVQVDLFFCDEKTQTLCLAEIKRGVCDDRAIGQILRYYQSAWRLLHSSQFRSMNLNYVWPILIVENVKEHHLQSLPVHFRGMLDVLTYQTAEDGCPELMSFRKAAITNQWI
ncbi:hypothetical protein [Paraburkholderia sp. 40]|uniref:hypothetical protein n=1 Tax=Paraburkholderia sp. 40 TaxID=2991059 RepID=UPI003D1A879B